MWIRIMVITGVLVLAVVVLPLSTAAQEREPEQIALPDLHFWEEKIQLNWVAKKLSEEDDKVVYLVCSHRQGTPKRLALRRLRDSRKYLISKGISSDRIHTVYAGAQGIGLVMRIVFLNRNEEVGSP